MTMNVLEKIALKVGIGLGLLLITAFKMRL